MKNFINKLNQGFIFGLLIIIYLFAVGMAKLLKTLLAVMSEEQKDTYWKEETIKKKINFESPY